MMKVGGPAAANSSFTGFGARSIDELDKRTVKRCRAGQALLPSSAVRQ
jgi:hypothetical protein